MSKRAQLSSAIAIIGMAGRFPDAENLRAFWRNLERGLESLIDFSEAEMRAAGVPRFLLDHPQFVKRGTVLEGSELFDAAFFGFNPREAEIIDPQHRIFLECAWEALEDAGYGGQNRPANTGIYAGASVNSYAMSSLGTRPEIVESVGFYQVMVAGDKDFLATRAAYKLNLKGPSMTVQTACSTSLVAIQVASQALIGNQCDMALAGGVSLIFPQTFGYLYSEGMILSPDGHCRPFDEQGRGIRGGQGVGIVVLKRLEDAIRDHDNIHAVILGAAVNNDGSAKMGYSAPSVEGQSSVIETAIRMSGIDPGTIGYVEAHGTGTPVGDPIEIAGLEKAYRAYTDKKQFCALGAVKGNIGHLDAAAGVAGFIKTVLTLKNKRIAPTVNFKKPNPAIDFGRSPFYIADRLSDWPANGSPRRAGVSSFGIGGTNAHAILEEAPLREPAHILWPAQLLTLSARTQTALDAMTLRLASYLEENPDCELADACYTLQVGRARFSHRRVLICGNRTEAVEALRGVGATKYRSAFDEAASRPIAFMFSGQGSQHRGMGRSLYGFQTVFRKNMDFCADVLQEHLGSDLREILFGEGGKPSAINETRVAQPALFAVEYSLARMWMAWGIEPDTMIGHSVGEYVAACLAGVFSLEDALRIVAERGRIMQAMPSGSMMAVGLTPSEIGPYLDENVQLAAVNSPSLCTLSGPENAIAAVRKRLEEPGIVCRLLHTSHAFHSKMMDRAAAAFLDVMRSVPLRPPNRPFISNVTGTTIRPKEATDPAYWAEHLRAPVQFEKGARELAESPNRVFLEVGPGQTLTTFARECTRGKTGYQVVPSLPPPSEDRSDALWVLDALGKLWLSGVPVNWDQLHQDERLYRTSLPPYFFERQRYFIDPRFSPIAPQTAPEPNGGSALPRRTPDEWFYVPSWQRGPLPGAVLPEAHHGPWILFSDGSEFADEVGSLLSNRAEHPIVVRRGDSFIRRDDFQYCIRSHEPDDYSRLWRELEERNALPNSLIYFWSLPNANLTGSGDGAGMAVFDELLFLAQTYAPADHKKRSNWILVTAGMQSVALGECTHPELAVVLGLAKVIPRECEQISCRAIDLPTGFSSQQEERAFAEALLLEPGMRRDERPVSYRAGFRWEQIFEPVRLSTGRQTIIKERGVYVITGGFGGIGFAIAEHLAKTAHARIVLIGRTPVPPRREETRRDEQGEGATEKLRKIERLENLGAEVLPITADVSDWKAMKAAIALARDRFGPINGAVHAAGVAEGRLIQLKTAEAAHRVFAAKIKGTLILDSLLDRTVLDFLVLCSSIDAIAPVAGAVDYSAANAFMDAYANSRWSGGRPKVFSINWDAWQEVGMAINEAITGPISEERRRYLQEAIHPAEGVEAFRQVVESGLPQLAVITHDLRIIIGAVSRNFSSDSQDLITESAPEDHRHSRPDLTNDFAAPETDTEKKMAEIWADLLGMKKVGVDDNFFELGGHSLLATGMLSRVRDSLSVSLPLRTIFEAPTIRKLANHVETLLWIGSGKSKSDDGVEREEVEL